MEDKSFKVGIFGEKGRGYFFFIFFLIFSIFLGLNLWNQGHKIIFWGIFLIMKGKHCPFFKILKKPMHNDRRLTKILFLSIF